MKIDLVVALIISVGPIIASVASIIAAIQARRVESKVQQLHVIVNSRLTELLDQTSKASRIQGQVDGRAEAESRAKS